MNILILLFILGLLIGSFLNVIALRYVPGKPMFARRTIGGRSECRNCTVTLKWYELIPLVSFIIQRARCRNCSSMLAWQYPLVELVTGIVTAALPYFIFNHFEAESLILTGQNIIWLIAFVVIWVVASYVAITMAAIDMRLKILPNQSNLLLAILGLLIVCLKLGYPERFLYGGSFLGSYSAVFWFEGNLLLGVLAAVATALLIFGGIVYLSRGRGMGIGDVKLAIPMALLLGWPDVILAFMAAFVVGALFGLVLLAYKVKHLREAIPFGPFLVIGMFVPIFYGADLLQWYFSLI